MAVPEERPVAKRNILSGFTSKRTDDEVQDDRNHKLRDALTEGDTQGITRRLEKGADPTAPSSVNQQNAFHKLASAEGFTKHKDLDSNTTMALINARSNRDNPASLGQAAIAKDVNGNTPIHLAQHSIGRTQTNIQKAEAKLARARELRDRARAADDHPDRIDSYQRSVNMYRTAVERNTDSQRRYKYLKNKLTAAAAANGHDVNSIQNNAENTPEQMYQAGQQDSERAHEADIEIQGHLGEAGLI